MKLVFAAAMLTVSMQAKMLIAPEAAMKIHFGESAVAKTSRLLSSDRLEAVQKEAQTRLESRLYTLYTTQNGGKGVLLTKKVRTKNAVALYLFGPDQALKAIEIIAFDEPDEYLPSKTWLKRFETEEGAWVPGKDIPALSGATLSANALGDLARAARAIIRLDERP